MPDIKHYFDEEMRHLQKAGRDFAQEYPDVARRLSLDGSDDHDPHVERLLEGFAFLTARVRQTLDMEDDGLAGHLLDLVAPGLEMPMPSTAQVEFLPKPSEFSQPVILRRGMQVQSALVGGLEFPCRFSLVRDALLHPVSLTQARIVEGDSGSGLEIVLEHWGRIPMASWPDPLPIYLHGDNALGWTMRYWLLRKVASVTLECDGRPQDGRGVSVHASDASPGYAFTMDPGGEALFSMRDFLNSDERFRHVEIRGLSCLAAEPGARLRLSLRFRDIFPRSLEREVGSELFRLHVVPVVNSFEDDCQPVQMDLSRIDYPLEGTRGRKQEILDVREVVGISQGDMTRRRTYQRFSSYRHLGRKGGDAAYYEIVRRESRGAARTSLALGCADPSVPLESEFLAVRALCCDGDLPRECLQPGDINVADPAMPASVELRGITRPSAVVRPADGAVRRWSLLAHFHRSFRGLGDLDLLKRTLEHLTWDGRDHRKRLVESLARVSSKPSWRFVKGVAFPEILVIIGIKDEQCTPSAWDRLGHLDAFGSMLWGIFGEEAPLGSTVRLRLEIEPAGVALEYFRGE